MTLELAVDLLSDALNQEMPDDNIPSEKYCDTGILPYFLVDKKLDFEMFLFLSLLFDSWRTYDIMVQVVTCC